MVSEPGEDGQVHLEIDGAVGTITLDRPDKLNAMTPSMARRLFEVADQVNAEDAVRVVVLRGAGNRAFCAGSDIKHFADYASTWEYRNRRNYVDAVWAIRKPVIVRLHGHVLGGGLEMALNSDLRVAGESARFACSEILRGWHAGDSVTLLPRLVGPGQAARLLLTGDTIDAAEAHRIGLVEYLVPDQDLDDKVRQLALSVAKNPPIALQVTKRLARTASLQPLEVARQWSEDAQVYCFETDDAKEGQAAFREKRPPLFKGR
jgi:enoyl-CoA hydratase